MNYDDIDNLNNEDLIKLYEDTLEAGEDKEISALYVRCLNGNTGYWYNDVPTGYRIYCGPDCSKRLYSICRNDCGTAKYVCGGANQEAIEISSEETNVLYVRCNNGKSGYWYLGYNLPIGYIQYCGPDCSKSLYSNCSSLCKSTASVCGGYSEIGIEKM